MLRFNAVLSLISYDIQTSCAITVNNNILQFLPTHFRVSMTIKIKLDSVLYTDVSVKGHPLVQITPLPH